MADDIKHAREVVEPARLHLERPQPFYATWPLSALGAGAFLAAVFLMIVSRQIRRAEAGDSAIWDYVAQSILRGQVPYKDVVEIKLPLMAYMSAGAAAIGKWFGIRDLIAIRALDFLLVGALSAATCLVAKTYVGSKPVAVISVLIPFTSGRFIEWMASGTEPRLGMILFGMLTLLLIAKDRPFLAGLAAALSCMSWQPGLLFAGVAFVIFSRYLTRWRDGRALSVLAGVAVPLAGMFLYFSWLGAARDLWSWTFEYTASVYAPGGFRGIFGNARHIWNVTSRVLGPGVLFLFVAAFGFFVLVWARTQRLETAGQRLAGPRDLYKDALLLAPLVYFLFCLVDFKSASYLIPAVPFLGIFGGLIFVKLARRLAGVRLGRVLIPGWMAEWAPVAVVLVIAFGNAIGSGRVRDRGLDIQTLQFKSVADLLGPNDRIYAHGATEVLAVLGRPNLNPFIFLDNNKDEYIARQTPVGFQTILDRMESAAPKVVVLSSLNRVAHRADIEAWVESHYEWNPTISHEIGYDLYQRKP